MKGNKNILLYFLIAVISLLFYVSFIGGVHLFDWDEINFAESAREMILTGDYLNVRINFLPFWEKPPLFIWMQALSMKIFGINEFAARFPDAVCGVATLLVLFNIGSRLYNRKFGIIWAMAFGCSILPFVYFKSGIIDPWFNLFIFLGIHQFIMYNRKKRIIHVILSAAFIGLGILTKGPVALLVFILTAGIFWLIRRFKKIITWGHAGIFIVTLVLVGGFWFILQLFHGNYTIIKDFIAYQIRLFQTKDAGHGGFFFYHFIVLLIGVFPASLFALQGFGSSRGDDPIQRDYKFWMTILFWVVLILFTIVKTKIVHYSSLCYFPLTFMAALAIYRYLENKLMISSWVISGIFFIGFLITLITASLPFVGKYSEQFVALLPKLDGYTKTMLLADVHWSGFEAAVLLILVAGMFAFLILIRKRKILPGITVLFLATAATTYLTLITDITKIEQYSQGAAIEYLQRVKNEDVYVVTLGYKSYAHLFYADKMPPVNPESYNQEWLLTGDIDKDAYFLCKISRRDDILKEYPELKELGEKNGFVFLVRRKVERGVGE